MRNVQSPPTRADLARELLRYKMLEYSDAFASAKWLSGMEFELWTGADLVDPSPCQQYLISLSRECRVIAEIAGGWWVNEDETQPTDNNGPVFVPMARWREILGNRDSEHQP